LGFHVAYGANGAWVNAVGNSLFDMTVSSYGAADTAASAWFTLDLPVLSTEGVTATGQGAWSCVTTCTSAWANAFLHGLVP
jgi:hypothetical protein